MCIYLTLNFLVFPCARHCARSCSLQINTEGYLPWKWLELYWKEKKLKPVITMQSVDVTIGAGHPGSPEERHWTLAPEGSEWIHRRKWCLSCILTDKEHPGREGGQRHVRLWSKCKGRRRGRRHVASGNSKSSHVAAALLGAGSKVNEFRRPGHERSYAMLQTLRPSLKQWEATAGF